MSDTSLSFLLAQKVITPDQLATAQYHQKKNGLSLQASLVALSFVDPSLLGPSQEPVSALRGTADLALSDLLPHAVKEKLGVVPLYRQGGTVFVGTTQIHNVILQDTLRKYIPENEIQLVYLAATEIKRLMGLQQYTSIEAILHQMSNPANTEAVTQFIDFILIQALKEDASDVHFHPQRNSIRILYRIDGMLHQTYSFHSDHWSQVVARLKVICSLNLAESRQPQSGKFSFQLGPRRVDCRLSTHPTLCGESAVIRVLEQTRALKSLQDLGLSQTGLETLQRVLKKPHGLVVMTGPTGSGKTTTLYAMLQHFSAQNLNIMTLEDPVEYQLPHIRQSQIQPGIQFTYAAGIKSMMRQDPDIILVGEIRDEETAQMALRAAMTGHLVLTTLHSPNTILALDRLVDLGLDPKLLITHINGLLSQRLVRRLCTPCQGQGCDTCGQQGFRGRFALIESFDMKQAAPCPDFRSAAQEAVRNGLTTLDECERHVDLSL